MNTASLTRTGPCVLPLLEPVRRCLHPFLGSTDVARLMQAGHHAASLLSGYVFTDHAFTYGTGYHLRRSIALYRQYNMYIVRLSLAVDWDEPLVNSSTGQSVLHHSLLALTLGQDTGNNTIVHAALDGSDGEIGESDVAGSGDVQSAVDRLTHFNGGDAGGCTRGWGWSVYRYEESISHFALRISPGTLPHGLRFLQFPHSFDQPLQVGDIPVTVEWLQFGRNFNQPLEVGHLPASLTHLAFGLLYRQPLLPGVLPAGLRRLHLGPGCLFGYPLLPGILPSHLQQLSFGGAHSFSRIAPGDIPSSVTHLRLNSSGNRLQAGSIPAGVILLNLGDFFNEPLLPGVLPTTLRELIISRSFNQPLRPGSLPDGLQVLVFNVKAEFQQPLLPKVIPASVKAISMGSAYNQRIVAGAIPATVKWLRLPASYAETNSVRVLSPSTRIVWWDSPSHRRCWHCCSISSVELG